MANVGGTYCTFVRGIFPALRQRSRRWSVPGIDGVGIVLLGTGDAGCGLLAVLLGTDAAVQSWAAELQAKQASIVTVVNDRGHSQGNCFLDRVGNCISTPGYVPGTAITTRGEIPIQLTVLE